jgi:hypothetical protein
METQEKITALKELSALPDAKIIGEEEFNRERKRILRSLPPIDSRLRDTLGLLSKMAWPLVALIFLFSLRQPIVSKLSEAEQLSVGSFSVKVREKARMAGNPELAEALSGLSQRAIELLMDTGDKQMAPVMRGPTKGEVGLDLSRTAYAELEAKGLLSGNESWSSFVAWATSLPGRSSVVYMTDTGLLLNRPNEPYVVAEQYLFEMDKLSLNDVRRLQEARFTLSDTGRRVWRLLGKVVAEQLTR